MMDNNDEYEVDIVEITELAKLQTLEDVMKRGIPQNDRNQHIYVSIRNSPLIISYVSKVLKNSKQSESNVLRHATMYGAVILESNYNFKQIRNIKLKLMGSLTFDNIRMVLNHNTFGFKTITTNGVSRIPTLFWIDGWAYENCDAMGVSASKLVGITAILGLSKSSRITNPSLLEQLKLEEKWIYENLDHTKNYLEIVCNKYNINK